MRRVDEYPVGGGLPGPVIEAAQVDAGYYVVEEGRSPRRGSGRLASAALWSLALVVNFLCVGVSFIARLFMALAFLLFIVSGVVFLFVQSEMTITLLIVSIGLGFLSFLVQAICLALQMTMAAKVAQAA
ncbi:hypothetical protein V8J38_16920 (plasmid) [Brevundimonas olei]|uniref:Uncharacterized protein n=1 Tax=Brevundimonas olei TaxID=657642 RepID=A0ABZ2IGD9_9CAUL